VDAGCLGGPDSGFPYAPSNFSPSALGTRGESVVIDCVAFYDTTNRTGSFCGAAVPGATLIAMTGGAQALVLSMSSLEITDAGLLAVIGDKPLIFAVWGDATIDGVLTAGANLYIPGPGGGLASCAGTGRNGSAGTDGGGGGGGGGSYGSRGAIGGASGAAGPSAGGASGLAFGIPQLVPLQGGCSGGMGGQSPPGCASQGGGGGGAVQISATGVLRVNAFIGAPGGGGVGGSPSAYCGGGGGGSGGAILLEATRLVAGASARITSGGGAGAEGSDPGNSAFALGENGRLDGTPARGGNSESPAAPGGDGGTGTVLAQPGSDYFGLFGGGGGGGGGAGRIRVNIVQGCTLGAPVTTLFNPRPTSNLLGDAGCP
jgi:hypothetical protein